MTAIDSSLHVRRAIVTLLKATPNASPRVYGPRVVADPVWPFHRVAVDGSEPYTAQCLNGSIVALTVHSFAKGEDEVAVSDLNAVVARAIAGKRIQLTDAPYPAHMYNVVWLRSQVIRDTAEATGWHGIVNFRAHVSS